jgi:general stress protein YciG
MTIEKKRKMGFAAMDPTKQRELAAKGGRAAHQMGTAHEFTTQEAEDAGRKGGLKVSKNIEHMRIIGRKGGLKRQKRKPDAEPREPLTDTTGCDV